MERGADVAARAESAEKAAGRPDADGFIATGESTVAAGPLA